MKKSDLLKKLSGGDRRSIGKSEEVVSEVLADARLFGALFDCILVDDPLVRMRAADAVEKITLLRPDFLKPCKSKLITRVAKIDQQEVRWHVAQLVSRLELNRSERKTVHDFLQRYLDDKSSIVRTFAMQALADIARQDAGLKRGIVKQLERLTKEGTPAMRSRGRKLLARLKP
ncbi:MAG: hypothetical protein HW412_692 [Bacteroidetes bacterium]|nr:hypothetical protein [Bacteroidota bacterium]